MYNSSQVTLENYAVLFRDCTPDIKDEIRSAVLDNTEIAKYIEVCGNDSYKLGQIRMAIREGINADFCSRYVSGAFIHAVRVGIGKGINMDSLLKYISPKGILVESKTLEILAGYVNMGVDITKVDFTSVPVKLVNTICDGLSKGYPMWVLQYDHEYADYTVDRVHALMRGMQLGLDVHPFTVGNWDINVLYMLFSYASRVDLNYVLRYIRDGYSLEHINVLLPALERGVDISKVCIHDEKGIPMFNQYQMAELLSAIEDDCATNEMFNCELSDMDILDIHRKELENRGKKLNVSLKHGRKA